LASTSVITFSPSLPSMAGKPSMSKPCAFCTAPVVAGAVAAAPPAARLSNSAIAHLSSLFKFQIEGFKFQVCG
jgi:hypothetical protein